MNVPIKQTTDIERNDLHKKQYCISYYSKSQTLAQMQSLALKFFFEVDVFIGISIAQYELYLVVYFLLLSQKIVKLCSSCPY